ncbi:cobalamin biosynthesis protein [Methanobacterium congolense]|uniref:Probable cobalamin biosynthesis protein CobD n=1 Tax=Methanobacterium congolense TaxID=118062 RepID=A0A1D3L5F9_9EURY|nr:cobalamin biosynthesis protein [Methanobacterium congolense]SCG86863.1 putative cobalamin biosynthesis protein CobD [Methanobacterium congolense]
MDPTSLIPIIIIAVVIDLLIGELPLKIHPVVLMGKCIDMFKHLKNEHPTFNTKLSGAIFTLTLVLMFSGIFILLLYVFSFNSLLLILVSAILLSTTFSINLLLSSAANVKSDLNLDIVKARKSLSYLVSRDTSQLSHENIVSAVIETLTENITDSIVSPLFYTFIFGVVGGVAYRVVNTLDAMVGYKNPENIKIGWFPAKFDDFLNYIPARITGIFVTLAALLLGLDWRNAYRIMRRDARKTPSPNSGYSMAAAAGALGIKLEKIGSYELGDELNPLIPEKIGEAIVLTKLTTALFITFASIVFGILVTTIPIFI